MLVCSDARACSVINFALQIGTTKGTGGDVLILEEAAYCDEVRELQTWARVRALTWFHRGSSTR